MFAWKRMAIFRLTPGAMQGFSRTYTLIFASNLVKQLPTATSRYNMNYARDYYNNIELPDGPFGFSHVHESQIMNILEKFNTNGLSGTFLKDYDKILSKPITDLINLSISLSTFPESCKVAKLKPLFKKWSKLEQKSSDRFPSCPDFKGS